VIKKMPFEQWLEVFKPRVNHLDEFASFDNGEGGLMFETYGEELDYVRKVFNGNPKRRIWTYVDGHDGTYIVDDYRIVNRIGYFVCDVPYEDGEQYEVQVSRNDAPADVA